MDAKEEVLKTFTTRLVLPEKSADMMAKDIRIDFIDGIT